MSNMTLFLHENNAACYMYHVVPVQLQIISPQRTSLNAGYDIVQVLPGYRMAVLNNEYQDQIHNICCKNWIQIQLQNTVTELK